MQKVEASHLLYTSTEFIIVLLRK